MIIKSKSYKKLKGGSLETIADYILSRDSYKNKTIFSIDEVTDIINKHIVKPIKKNFVLIHGLSTEITNETIREYDFDNNGTFDRNEAKIAIEGYLDWLSGELLSYDKKKWLRAFFGKIEADQFTTNIEAQLPLPNILTGISEYILSRNPYRNKQTFSINEVKELINNDVIKRLKKNDIILNQVPEITNDNIKEYDFDNNGTFDRNEAKIAIEGYLDWLSGVLTEYNRNKWIEILQDYVQHTTDHVPVFTRAPVPIQTRAPVPVPVQTRTRTREQIDLNDLGIDIISGDTDPTTRISEFIEDNSADGSVIIKVFDSAQHIKNYLFNKKVFRENMLIPENTVYACSRPGSMYSVDRNIQYLSMAKIINRRLIVNIADFNVNNANNNNVFMLLTKSQRTVPSIASYNVVHNLVNDYTSALHCNAGGEPEQIWNLTFIQPVSIRGGKTKKKNTNRNRKSQKTKNI